MQLLELNDLTHTSRQDRVARKIVKTFKKKESRAKYDSAQRRLLLRDAMNRAQTRDHFIAAQSDYLSLGKQFL